MFEDKNDTILAKWLANELSPEELAEFQKTDEYLQYKAITQASSRFSKPDYDKDASFSRLLEKREASQKVKVISLKKVSYGLAIACSLLLLFGIFFNTKTYSTSIGEQLVINLPDGSKVNLNANSELSHSRFFWTNNREVDLQGEAFFDVEKGQTFSVVTSLGTVSVLGTEFNVKVRQNTFNLQCYEGKVQFKDAKNNDVILTPTDAIQVINGTLEKGSVSEKNPSWLSGLSQFKNETLSSVLDDLKSQYNIKVDADTVDLNQRFTGSFVHNNLETALETVLVPMGIEYTLTDGVLKLNSN